MDPEKRYKDLLRQKRKIEKLLDQAKRNLGHPHLDFMSVHDLAESQYKVYSSHLESIEEELDKLSKLKKLKGR
jgi:hypothetical protein